MNDIREERIKLIKTQKVAKQKNVKTNIDQITKIVRLV